MLLQQTQRDSFEGKLENYGTSVVPRSEIRWQLADEDRFIYTCMESCAFKVDWGKCHLVVMFNIKSVKCVWCQHLEVL